MKNFEHQYYRHKSHRPQAEFSLDKSGALFTVSFSWGEISVSEKVNNSIVSYYFAAMNDIEVTSPFELLPSLSPLANKIRSAILIANGAIYSSFNNKAYSAGCEFLCVGLEGQEFVIGQVGGPSVVLVRGGDNILLTTTADHCNTKLDPLPSALMGVELECYPQISSFRFEEGDQLFFISRSYLPKSLLTLNLNTSMQSLSKLISDENPKIPFWISRLTL